MKTDPITVSSTTPTFEALELMGYNKVGCLPVVDDGELVGIVTSYDFLDASARLFKEQLTASTAPAKASSQDAPSLRREPMVAGFPSSLE